MSAARASAELVVAAARAGAAAMVEEARAEGRRDADRDNQGRGSDAAREARETVLAARPAAYESLVAASVRRALELRSHPAYAALLESLRAAAGAQLGPGAAIDLDPPVAGGVIAHLGARRVDYSLPALARRCLEGLGPRVEELWR